MPSRVYNQTLPTPEIFPSPKHGRAAHPTPCRSTISRSPSATLYNTRYDVVAAVVVVGWRTCAVARVRVCAWTLALRVRPTNGACVCVNEHDRPSPSKRVCACVFVRACVRPKYRVPYWYARWCATTRDPPRCIVLPVYRSCTVPPPSLLLLLLLTRRRRHHGHRSWRRVCVCVWYTGTPTDDGRRCTTSVATAAVASVGRLRRRRSRWYGRLFTATASR